MMKEEIFELDPQEVKINEELPRVRKTMAKIEKLAESFSKFGQMQPIVVNRRYELIAGGRRLEACRLIKAKVKCCYSDTIDPLKMREMELEENLQRENLSPAEEVLAVEEIYHLKRKLYGEATSGRKGGWTLNDTAEMMDRTRGSIVDDLQLAVMVRAFPELKNAKRKSDIRKVAKALTKVGERIDGIKKYEQVLRSGNVSKFDISQQDASEFMAKRPDSSVNLLFTDPPWGIEIDRLTLGVGGVTGGVSSSGVKYSDDRDKAIEDYSYIGKESVRFCTSNAHAYVFCAPEYFWLVRSIWLALGWLVSPRPFIWIKKETGQNNAPHAWPSAAYEFILFARRSDSRLVMEGRPDWKQVDPVPPSERLHHSEKPIGLIKELIERTSLPGDTLCDPYMGSGVMIEAALRHKMFAVGCDNAVESYAATMQRIAKWSKEQK